MRKTRKQRGGNMIEAQSRINEWILEDDPDEMLSLSGLDLTSLPPLPDNLKRLDCSFNNLTRLPSLPESLVYLSCYSNKLKSLPHLPDSLKLLFCHDNELRSLPFLPTKLYMLSISDNDLPEIYYKIPADGNEPFDLVHIERIREIQKRELEKIKGNRLRNLKNHIAEPKRKKFANNIQNTNPLNPIVMKNIANYLNEENLQYIKSNNNNNKSLKPSIVEFKANRSAARKRLSARNRWEKKKGWTTRKLPNNLKNIWKQINANREGKRYY